jgi:hypothetical protein
MSDVVAALLLALAAENAELREQLASAQDMFVETAIDAGNMHALVEAMRTERDAWREEAERLALPASADHDREASRNLIALPAVKAPGNEQNLLSPVGLKLIPGPPRHSSA